MRAAVEIVLIGMGVVRLLTAVIVPYVGNDRLRDLSTEFGSMKPNIAAAHFNRPASRTLGLVWQELGLTEAPCPNS